MQLEEAKQLAEKWVRILNECCCERIDVVAGVWRGKPEPKDVDLLCSPKGRDMEPLRALNPVKEDSVRIVYNDEGRKVEVWHTTPERYDLIRWYRRLEAKDFIALASKAKEKGLKLSWKRGLMKGDEVVTSNPSEIERILG